MQISFCRKIAILAAVLGSLAFFVSGCNPPPPADDEGKEEKPKVVVTLSFFEDMVRQIGSDKIELKALVPVGVEPEEYEPVPADLRAINDAAVFIYNGHNIERWLPRVIPDLEQRANCFALGEHPSIKTIPLPDGPFAGEPDPHVWTDVANAVIYGEQIAAILSEIDPENKEYYREQADRYTEELRDLTTGSGIRWRKFPRKNVS